MKAVIFIGFCLCLLLPPGSEAKAAGRVLLVHSYHAGYLWTDEISRGVRKGLAGTGAALEIFYMDTQRNPGEAWKIRAGVRAKEAVSRIKPDVVIAADDNAQVYFAGDYAGKSYPQIVFCGVNADASKYGFPACNVTGILERPYFVQSFDMLKAIVPGADSVAVITDASPTSDQLIAYMKTRPLPIRTTAVDQPSTFPDWKACILSYQNSVDAICVILYHTLTKGEGRGKSVSPRTVMNWTLANNRKPLFSVAMFCIEDGAIFGVVNSAHEQGLEAARIAREILKGEKAGSFPVVRPRKGAVWINIRTAEKMGFEVPFDIIRATDRILE